MVIKVRPTSRDGESPGDYHWNGNSYGIGRDERDFGLETETETRVVSRPVSSFETTCQKSQYQSQNLRLILKVSVSVSYFETTMQKFWSQSQNVGLAHHRTEAMEASL